ncbi:hypothetical protein [Deinococcus roseus]|uniref:Uncharacterized protein n=1 Tax=Deinococcus roseus TaxID=392414 RepID=A0ABQ2CZM8_9DEIO|nr:hypothetical protein [Deinococcus roseus]GGJ35118.1 hypothetical protein GCM10008938_21530 [Deinococcus roseus]
MEIRKQLDPTLGALFTEAFEGESVSSWEGRIDLGLYGEEVPMTVLVTEEEITDEHRDAFDEVSSDPERYVRLAYQEIQFELQDRPEKYGLGSEAADIAVTLLGSGQGSEVLFDPLVVIHPGQDGQTCFGIGFKESQLDVQDGTGVLFLDGRPVAVLSLSQLLDLPEDTSA